MSETTRGTVSRHLSRRRNLSGWRYDARRWNDARCRYDCRRRDDTGCGNDTRRGVARAESGERGSRLAEGVEPDATRGELPLHVEDRLPVQADAHARRLVPHFQYIVLVRPPPALLVGEHLHARALVSGAEVVEPLRDVALH